jgi:hypothetical protein
VVLAQSQQLRPVAAEAAGGAGGAAAAELRVAVGLAAVLEAAGEPGVLGAVARTAPEERMCPEMTRMDQSRARLSV